MLKKKLQDYRAERKKSEKLQNQLNEIEDLVNSITTHLTDMPKGKAYTLDARIADMMDAKTELLDSQTKSVSAMLEIERIIASLPLTEQEICRYRYIDGMTFEEIAYVTNYSWRQVHRIHGRALANITAARIETPPHE